MLWKNIRLNFTPKLPVWKHSCNRHVKKPSGGEVWQMTDLQRWKIFEGGTYPIIITVITYNFLFYFSLEEQHKNELVVYKTDLEKLKQLSNDEMNNLTQLLSRHRVRCTGRVDVDIQKLVSEKDEKINEMTTRLRQIKVYLNHTSFAFNF